MNILSLLLLTASASPFTVEIPEGVTTADGLVIYVFERPVRVVAERNLFADEFE
jgi:hypothetical protein